MPDTDWRLHAACRTSGLHPDTWFALPGDHAARNAAIRVCRRCPVVRDCAAYALKTQPPHGVWGGLTQTQLTALIGIPAARRSFVSHATLKPCGTLAAYKRHIRNGERPCESCLKANRRNNHDKSVSR